jgi:hypothetical protein
MSDPPGFTEVVDSLRALLDAEYRRGQADAARRIIEVAQAEVSPRTAITVIAQAGVPIEAVTTATRNKDPKSRRAPIGIPDSLLRRVLTERGDAGASAHEILAAAQPGDEQLVSLSGVRFAFDQGKKAGRYRSERGRWFLASQAVNEFQLEEEKN